EVHRAADLVDRDVADALKLGEGGLGLLGVRPRVTPRLPGQVARMGPAVAVVVGQEDERDRQDARGVRAGAEALALVPLGLDAPDAAGHGYPPPLTTASGAPASSARLRSA